MQAKLTVYITVPDDFSAKDGDELALKVDNIIDNAFECDTIFTKLVEDWES